MRTPVDFPEKPLYLDPVRVEREYWRELVVAMAGMSSPPWSVLRDARAGLPGVTGDDVSGPAR